MMQEEIENTPELEMLFELFNEDFSEDLESHDSADSPNGEDVGDDTSSESSGSSCRSSLTSTSLNSPQHISTYYPCPPSVVFAANPLSSFVSSNISSNDDEAVQCNNSSNKRTKTEDKLMRNRESANKSRLKRKNEKLQLEETVASLQERVRTLEMENTALLTDNTTLSQHNFFLQSILKKQQDESSNVFKSEEAPRPSHMSALSGISMLCVVFSISFFNEWLPSSLQAPADSGEDSYALGDSTGRVLLSVDDDDYSSSSYVFVDRSQQPQVALHYVLLVGAMFVYYFYIQRCKAAEKEQSRILPS